MGTRNLGQVGLQSNIDHSVLDWITRVSKYLETTADTNGGSRGANGNGMPAGPQVFPGCATFLGGYAEDTIQGLGIPTVKITRMAPLASTGINNALTVLSTIPKNSTASEWLQLNRMNVQADAGGAVGFTSQAYKHGLADTFSGVFEAQDFSGDPNSALVAIEVDVTFGGIDTLSRKIGLNIVYGDCAPNTLNPSGPTVSVGNLIQCDPFGQIARFQALSALRTNGTYTNAALDLSGLTNTPFAISFPGGSHLLFRSSTSGYSRTYWYPNGAYVPTYIGALEIVIDGNFEYIPVASNMP